MTAIDQYLHSKYRRDKIETMGRTAAQEAAFANRMLSRADQYLAAVDEAYIVKERGHSLRPMPKFRPEEISLGKELGRGGFGVVCEIKKFTLDPDDAANTPPDNENPQASDDPDVETGLQRTTDNAMRRSSHLSDIADSEHYAIDKARHVMEHKVLKRDSPRYALKMLHHDLSEVEKARGMIDLALEAKYLAIVWHPNISKLWVGNAIDSVSHSTLMILPCVRLSSQNERYGKGENGGSRFLYHFGSFARDIDQANESLAQRLSQIQLDCPWFVQEQKGSGRASVGADDCGV